LPVDHEHHSVVYGDEFAIGKGDQSVLFSHCLSNGRGSAQFR
jgi:hypothetical protein